MNIKTIVKVMNFHALIRVDRAHKEAETYAMLEKQVARLMDIIQNNRNLILDKKVQKIENNAPRLRIYIGSDLGFCGSVNASVNQALSKENGDNDVIIVGKKIHSKFPVLLQLSRDEFDSRYDEIYAIIKDAVLLKKYSGVDLCYDRYIDMSHIEPVEKTVFPVEINKSTDNKETYSEDFAVEGGDVSRIMEKLIITYLNYEVKIAIINSFASENILRQSATNESLKRIDEMEQEALWKKRKVQNLKSAQKSIDSFIKTKSRKNS